MDAEDLRLIATLARLSTAAATSVALNTHVATIYRRLKALETHAGERLFDKIDGRYEPTPLGTELAALSDAIQDRLAEAQRRLAGGDKRLGGRIVVTTADSLVPLVSRLIEAFRKEHPSLSFDFVVANSFADIGRYEAEVAIRPTRTPPESLVGQMAGTFGYGIYRAAGQGASEHWVALDDSLAAIPSARWLAKELPIGPIVLRVNSMWAAAQAAAAGIGKALLPDYLGREFSLVREDRLIPEIDSQVWMLIHPDLRRTARVRAFLDFGAPYMRARLAGKAK
jgi:DNA-binding transcriptional LysR family regulator